jgi:hypothetical protein
VKEEEKYGDQPVPEVDPSAPEGDQPTFEGSSEFSLEHAIHQAAEDAQKYFGPQVAEEKIYLEIVRQEVVIGNPHISEYRVRIKQSGGSA